MIKRINLIQNRAIFRNFSWNNLIDDFGARNLFYGWNGSGKSTLAKIFQDIEEKTIAKNENIKFSDANNVVYDYANQTNFTEKIFVFNSSFIANNIGTYEELKGIIYLSSENKEAKESLDIVLSQESLKKQDKKSLDAKYSQLSNEFDKVLSRVAKSIKEEFHVVGGAGNLLSNYNKSNLQLFISKNNSFLESKIDEAEIILLIQKQKEIIKETIKEKVKNEKGFLFDKKIRSIIPRLESVLKETVAKKVSIDVGDEIFNWIEEGYKLTKTEICNYCGSIISKERNELLKNIFNIEYDALSNKINDLQKDFKNIELIDFPIKEEQFYSELTPSLIAIKQQFDDKTKRLKDALHAYWLDLLHKKNDIYNKIDITQILEETFFDDLLKLETELNSLLEENNNRTESYTKRQEVAVYELEKLLVYKLNLDAQLLTKLNELNLVTKKVKDSEIELLLLEKERIQCETKLVDVLKAASQFNTLLSKFIGRDEINLEYDPISKGYKIIRKENKLTARGLSEGEKTAIAFIYFLTKLYEKGNLIENSIIVIDDPVSSLDSNNLFNAYSFIMSFFGKAQQLFLLSHNFTFFRLFKSRNVTGNKNLYLIDNQIFRDAHGNELREAKICNLPRALKDSQSEYSFLFKCLYEFATKTDTEAVGLTELLSIANIARKVLENFSSFKFMNLTNLEQLLTALYTGDSTKNTSNISPELQMEYNRIYKFCQFGSHDKNIDAQSDEIDWLLTEAHVICKDILKLIERMDTNHYNSLLKML